MSINVSSNIISSTGFDSSGNILNTPNIVTDGLVLWYDAGNNASYINSSNYYDCGYGCQYYASDPGCTHCNTQIKDMSGNGYDGTLLYSTTVAYDNTGGSLSLNGTNQFVSIPGTFMNTSSQYSISVWFKKSSSANTKTLICKDKSTTHIQYAIYWDVSNVFNFTHATADVTAVVTTYTSWNANVINNGWHNVVGLWDGSYIRLYADGVAVGTPTAAATGYAYTDADRHSVGRYGGYNGYYFDGNIAVVMIHNKALSAAEVLQNFNTDRQRFGI